jgi:hypothetical protein
VGQQLERVAVRQAGVLHLVHLTHAALAYPADDPVRVLQQGPGLQLAHARALDGRV